MEWSFRKKYRIESKKASNILIGIFLLGIYSILFIANEQGSMNIPIAVLIILTDVIMIYKCRNNWFALVITGVISYYNYSICMAEYLFVSENTTYYTYYSGSVYSNKGIVILAIFNLLLFFAMLRISENFGNKRTNCSILENNKSNSFIVILLCIALVLIWFFGFKRPDNIGERGTPNPYFEYSIILIILGYYYSGNDRIRINALNIISFSYVLLNFLYGGRATGIQIVLCLVLCIWANHINNRILFIGGIALFFFMTLIGMMRANWVLDSESFSNVYNRLMDTKFTNDTSFSAYHTSLTFINYLDMVDWHERIVLFGSFLMSIFAGGSVYGSNLSMITRQFFYHNYGGVLPFYFFFYLGYAGLAVIAVYMFIVLRNTIRNGSEHNGLGRCIGIYVASTSLRWYIFSPFQLTRGVMLMIVAFYLLKFLDSLFERKKFRKE